MGDEAWPKTIAQKVCRQCGGTLELLICLQKTVGSPAYKIFYCTDCEVIDWVAEESPPNRFSQ